MENLPIKTITTVNVLWEIKCVPVYAPLPRPCHDCKEWQHRRRNVRVWVVNNNAGSRPWDKGWGGGGVQVIQTLRWWGGGSRSPKKIFSALRVSVWSKNNGWPGPLDPPLNKIQGWTMHPLSSRAIHSLAWSLGVTQQIRRFCSQGEMDHQKVMWVGVVEVQNKYSCKGEIYVS